MTNTKIKAKTDPQSIWEQYQQGRRYKEAINLYEDVRLNENFYLGRQWEGLNAPDLPKPVLNFLKRVVTYVIATISSNDIAVSLSPHDDTNQDKELTAKAVSRQLEKVIENTKFKSALRQRIRDVAVDGDACMYFRFDPDIQTGQAAQGDIVCESIDNINVIFGNAYNRDVQTQPYIIICQRKKVGELKRECRESGVPEDQIQLIQEDTDTYQREKGDDANLCTKLIKLWKENGEIWYTSTTEKAVIDKPTNTGLNLYPVAWMSWDEVKSSYHGQALLTGLIPNQIEVNRLFACYVRSVSMNAFPKIVYDSDKIAKWTNKAGEAIATRGIGVGRVNDYVTAIRGGDVSYQVMEVIQQTVTMTRDFMGASDAALGNVKPDNTSAIIAVQQASSMPLEIQRMNLFQFTEDCVRIMMDIMRSYYGVRTVTLDEPIRQPVTDEIGNQVTDEMGNPATHDIGQLELDFSTFDTINYDTNVDVGASSYWSELMQVQTMDNLFAKGIITDAVLYLESIPGKYLKNRDKIIASVKEQQQLMQQQAMLMQEQQMQQQIPTADMPITNIHAEELVNQVASARQEIMNQ